MASETKSTSTPNYLGKTPDDPPAHGEGVELNSNLFSNLINLATTAISGDHTHTFNDVVLDDCGGAECTCYTPPTCNKNPQPYAYPIMYDACTCITVPCSTPYTYWGDCSPSNCGKTSTCRTCRNCPTTECIVTCTTCQTCTTCVTCV